MFRLLALCFMVVLSQGIQGQLLVNYPYNPDEDDNQMIESPDLLGFLSYYGEPFTPEPILVDSTDLGSVLTSMQQTIVGLQNQLDSLQNLVSQNSLIIQENGSTILDSAQIINFVGDGVSVSADTLNTNKAVVTIPGGGGGSNGVYVIKLEFTGLGVLTANPFLAAEDPNGNDILNEWTFNRISNTVIQVIHNENKIPVNFMTHSWIPNDSFYTSRHIFAPQNGNLLFTTSSYFYIQGLERTLIGVQGDHAYITFQFPENNILIE